MNLTIRASLHPAQTVVHNDPARFRVVNAGRRWGKTRLGVMECLDVSLANGRAWWVAPSYKIAQVGWRPLQRLARRIPGASVKLAAIMDKPDRRKVDLKVDYPGIVIPDEFVVGYGLDFKGRYRNLPDVCVLKPEIYKNS